jgi:hypothetical protein
MKSSASSALNEYFDASASTTSETFIFREWENERKREKWLLFIRKKVFQFYIENPSSHSEENNKKH